MNQDNYQPSTEPMTNGIAQLPSSSLWRVSVETYHAMIEAGILADDDPIELLQGWMVKKTPKNRNIA